MTQPMKVLSYLKEHKIATTNELRAHLMIVDVPKAVSILIRRGFPITGKRNHDNTATYYWEGKPATAWSEENFIFTKDGRAIPREEPKQETFI